MSSPSNATDPGSRHVHLALPDPTRPIDFFRLAKPFPPDQIEWRLQQAGKKNDRIWGMALAYINNRAIQTRLDEVCGPSRWRNEYAKGPDGGVLCGISIWCGPEEGWVTKWDGAENTDIEATKGGLSGAMKRAAVQWGIGRYLYDLPEGWINADPQGQYRGKTKEGDWFNWNPPTLPAWALPEDFRGAQRGARAEEVQDNAGPSEEDAAALTEVLAFIRETAVKAGKEGTFELEGTTYRVQEYVKAYWDTLQQDLAFARQVAGALDQQPLGDAEALAAQGKPVHATGRARAARRA